MSINPLSHLTPHFYYFKWNQVIFSNGKLAQCALPKLSFVTTVSPLFGNWQVRENSTFKNFQLFSAKRYCDNKHISNLSKYRWCEWNDQGALVSTNAMPKSTTSTLEYATWQLACTKRFNYSSKSTRISRNPNYLALQRYAVIGGIWLWIWRWLLK